MADVRVENHGTVFLFFLYTEAAIAWVRDNCAEEDQQNPLPVEHRFAEELAAGMIADGLEVI
jgi:hypothetical protein